ncbi:hypothetical protein DXG01_004779, partial [Tephrocybe rancida]
SPGIPARVILNPKAFPCIYNYDLEILDPILMIPEIKADETQDLHESLADELSRVSN